MNKDGGSVKSGKKGKKFQPPTNAMSSRRSSNKIKVNESHELTEKLEEEKRNILEDAGNSDCDMEIDFSQLAHEAEANAKKQKHGITR